MIILHAYWHHALLHLWGERTQPDRDQRETSRRRELVASTEFALPVEELRPVLGDIWDSLLVTGATDGRLGLWLPSVGNAIVSSQTVLSENGKDKPDHSEPDATLTAHELGTVTFAAADALDLLAACPGPARDDVILGDSARYWIKLGRFVVSLLARQRFVPAIHVDREGSYCGYWRVLVDNQQDAKRIQVLIRAMPPVCRTPVDDGESPSASALVEDFLWRTVDAVVRRGLEGDEIAHVLHERAKTDDSPQLRWLRALVQADARLVGTTEECASVKETVDGWLAKLKPSIQPRAFRTCFRLEWNPQSDTAEEIASPETGWTLSLHVQSTDDPSKVVEASQLRAELTGAPPILDRPFSDALENLRADIARAARSFPPLEPCTHHDGPLKATLTLEEAYRFLRDAAPVLRAEGFGVWVPDWWHQERPRLRTRLNIGPCEGQAVATGIRMGLETLVDYDWTVALGDEELSLEEITRLAQAKTSLMQVRGRWTELRSSDVEAALRFLKANRGGQMTVFEALRVSYAADDLDTGLPVAGLRARGWIENLLNASDLGELIGKVDPPSTFHGTLRPYQLHGLRWMAFLSQHGLGACLADDMGLGKTIQLIALLLHERESEQKPGPTLLVVPMSLVGNWARELERFAPSLKVMVHHGLDRLTGDEFQTEAASCDVVISTYGLSHRDRDHLAEVQWYRIALDEAQNIKNPAAKQAVALRSLPSVSRVALTGTPVENRLSDLWSIMDFLNPGYLGSAGEFRRRFAVPIERYRDEDRADRLRNLIRPFVLRRLKDDPKVAADLPEKMEMTVYCNLTHEQAALYEATVGEMLTQIESSGGIQRRGLVLAALVKLKQICNHPAQFLGESSAAMQRSGKFDRLTEMLEEVLAEEHRALVFTQFRKMGDLLTNHLINAFGPTVPFMHGGISQPKRQEMIDRFQAYSDDARIFVLSLKTGGVGLNLTAANHVFHYDRWWNPAVEDQATDRAHRIGQYRTVQVHKFVCVGTLEERIEAMSEQKRKLARNIIGSGDEWITEMSSDALRDFFTLSHEAVGDY